MKKTAARSVLAFVLSFWIVMLAALTVEANTDGEPVGARTHCVTTPPVGDPVCDPTADDHRDEDEDSPTPTGRRSSSRPPSGSPSSPRPTSSGMTSPPGQASPSPSEEPTRSFESEISIRYRRGRFFGVVRSRSDRCESRRDVTLRESKNGRTVTAGVDRTNRSGSWSERFRRAKGRFYATVSAKRIDTARGTIRCQRARSRTIKV